MPTFDTQKFKEAYESLDPEKLRGLLREDVVLDAEILETPIEGRDVYLRMLDTVRPLVEHLEVDFENVVQEGNDLACIVRYSMTMSGDLQIGDVHLPTDGKTIRGEAALFGTLDDEGRLRSITRFRDSYALMRQMGLSPEESAEAIEAVARLAKKSGEEMVQALGGGKGTA